MQGVMNSKFIYFQEINKNITLESKIWREKRQNSPWCPGGKRPRLWCESLVSLAVSPGDLGQGGSEPRRIPEPLMSQGNWLGLSSFFSRQGRLFQGGSEPRRLREVCHLVGPGVTSWHQKRAQKSARRPPRSQSSSLGALLELGHAGQALEGPGDPGNVKISLEASGRNPGKTKKSNLH